MDMVEGYLSKLQWTATNCTIVLTFVAVCCPATWLRNRPESSHEICSVFDIYMFYFNAFQLMTKGLTVKLKTETDQFLACTRCTDYSYWRLMTGTLCVEV